MPVNVAKGANMNTQHMSDTELKMEKKMDPTNKMVATLMARTCLFLIRLHWTAVLWVHMWVCIKHNERKIRGKMFLGKLVYISRSINLH